MDLTAAVRGLLEKYGKLPLAPPAPQTWRLTSGPPAGDGGGDGVTLAPGWALAAEAADDWLPLLPWRHERRFQELKRLVDERTVEPLLMCRFSCLTDGSSLDLPAVLYREFDLAEWLSGATITGLHASIEAGRWANVLVRLANGALCGVETGATLPAGAAMLDRHELIARRGVACDRVVDTQVPQSSVYALTAAGDERYTDTDAELFGLSVEEASLVRAAYDLLVHAERADAWRRQHRRLAGLVRLAFDSDRRRERLAVA
jgi:hypothetical protein